MLPADFCKRALNTSAKNIQLIDETKLRKWTCYLSEDEDGGQYRLTGGWKGFRKLNRVKVGEVVTFGVISERARIMFFKRVRSN